MQRIAIALVCPALVLLACGQVEHDPHANVPSPGSTASGGAKAEGGSATGGAAAGSSGAAAAGVAAAGAAGGLSEPEPPPVDISGRWAMFEFEDPVGVQLNQNGNELTGEGCAAGAPPLGELGSASFCGAISGTVHGNQASFGFSFEWGYHYAASVTVSADGQRMTGSFHAVQELATPTAWLRVPRDYAWLPYDAEVSSWGDTLNGRYVLRLLSSRSGGTEYDAGSEYSLGYTGHGIYGDLGSFWQSEMDDAVAEGLIRVGPVSMTTPELPLFLELVVGADGFTQVSAVTGSGNEYVFSAELVPPGQ